MSYIILSQSKPPAVTVSSKCSQNAIRFSAGLARKRSVTWSFKNYLKFRNKSLNIALRSRMHQQ